MKQNVVVVVVVVVVVTTCKRHRAYFCSGSRVSVHVVCRIPCIAGVSMSSRSLSLIIKCDIVRLLADYFFCRMIDISSLLTVLYHLFL